MAELPKGTATLLFSDIEGSTRLLQQLGDRYAHALHTHRQLLREAFRRYDGAEIGTEGDGFFVVFGRAADAVAAAVAAQQALSRYPWPPGEAVRVRMGLHTGEPQLDSGDYIGYDVHRAARVCASAHGGQIVVTEVTKQLAGGGAEVHFTDLGRHRLKDLGEAEHLFQAWAEGLPAQFPPLRSLNAVPTNLPNQLTSFVGREDDVRRLRELVTQHRLVTLTGPGGAGKTRLATHVAAELLHHFHDGVWLVRLAPVGDPDLVARTIAITMGLRDFANQPPVDVVADYSNGKNLLLLLDNFEHLMPATSVVTELVQKAPGVTLLVTSREVLNLHGEQEMAVPPLRLPAPDAPTDPVRLGHTESVRLFVDRARAVSPSFAVTNDNAACLAQVVHRLEGLPLAIELAAARTKVLSLPALAARLGDRLGLLTGGSRDLPERQRTLRATVEWSFGLLEDDERRLLARLSVFSAPVQLETVQAVCAWDDRDVLPMLAALVDKSLVQRSDSDPGSVSFWTLEAVKDFAREELRSQGDYQELRSRHADHYAVLSRRFRTEVFGAIQVPWLDRVEREQANFQAAIQWCLDAGMVDEAATISEGIHPFWWIRGHYGTGRYWLRRVLAAGISDPVLQARAHIANARLATDQAAFEESQAGLLEAVAVAREHGEEAVVASAVSELTAVRIRRGDHRDDESVAAALDTFHRLGDVSAEAELLIRIASVMTGRGDLAESTRIHRNALSLMRRAGNSWGTAAALNNIGYMAALEERFDEALAYLEESRALFEAVGTKEGLASAHDTLALVTAGRGDLAAAVAHYETSRELFREISYRPGIATEQVHLGRTQAERGEYEQAAACLHDGLRIAETTDDLETQAFAIEGIAFLLLRTDRPEEAALLYAGARRFRAGAGLSLARVDRRRVERDEALLAERLDPAARAGASVRGERLTREELIELARTALEPSAGAASAPDAAPGQADAIRPSSTIRLTSRSTTLYGRTEPNG